MANQGLRDLCFQLLSASAEPYLDLQWSDGRFGTRPEHPTDEWNFYDQQYLLPAALLYTTDRPDNPWRGSARLWEAILRNGRHLATRVAADGTRRFAAGDRRAADELHRGEHTVAQDGVGVKVAEHVHYLQARPSLSGALLNRPTGLRETRGLHENDVNADLLDPLPGYHDVIVAPEQP